VSRGPGSLIAPIHRAPPAASFDDAGAGVDSLGAPIRGALIHGAPVAPGASTADARRRSRRTPLLRMHTVVAAALAAAAIFALACAGGVPARSTTPAGPAPASAGREPTMPGDPRAEITELDRQITAELARADVTAPPIASCSGDACVSALAAPFATPTAEDPACHPAPSDHCSDVCKLDRSICHNQDRICELAKSLPGDDWAANKCTSARASCQSAHQRCCGCTA
jgi:hypothetical protein